MSKYWTTEYIDLSPFLPKMEDRMFPYLHETWPTIKAYLDGLPEKLCPNHHTPFHISVGWYGAKFECYDCLTDEAESVHLRQ